MFIFALKIPLVLQVKKIEVSYLRINTGVVNIINSNTIKCLVTRYCYIPLQVKNECDYARNLIC